MCGVLWFTNNTIGRITNLPVSPFQILRIIRLISRKIILILCKIKLNLNLNSFGSNLTMKTICVIEGRNKKEKTQLLSC